MPKKPVSSQGMPDENKGKENRDGYNDKKNMYDLYVRKHYNVQVVKLQPNSLPGKGIVLLIER